MVSAVQEDASSSQRDNRFTYSKKRPALQLAFFSFIMYPLYMMNAYDKALSLLAVREHTAKEIFDKLILKGYMEDEASSAVSRLVAERAISEERFAEVFIRSRMRKNPEGRQIILMRLRERGCPDSVSRKAVNEYWDSGAFIPYLKESYLSLLRKKGREGTVAFLLRKGFSMKEIRNAEEEFTADER